MSAKIVWAPQPGPQQAYVDCPVGEIFMGGARGGGKTDAVLGKWALLAQKYGRLFNAIMFRRTSVSAEDAIERSKAIYKPMGAKYNAQMKSWRFGPSFVSGARIRFRYLDAVRDAEHYQGQNVTHAWVEEVGQYATPEPIDRLYGALRSAEGIPTQLTVTGNPGGRGQTWLRDRYQLYPLPLRPTIVRRESLEGSIVEAAVIPARLGDNRILLAHDPQYVDRLRLVGNRKLVQAWLDGDWSAIEGAYFDEWDEDTHVIEPFAIPQGWTRIVSFDWGSARPFSVGWWAVVADDAHGLPQGAMVRYREWYGCGRTPNTGIKLPADEVGAGIRKRQSGDRIDIYVADPSIFAQDGGPSIAERMKLAWTRGDNRRVGGMGSVGGWDQMRMRLRDKMLFVFSTCTDFIRTVPLLQHDETRAEDVDSESEDHCFAPGTLVWTIFGARRVETLTRGFCKTPIGWRWYRNGRKTRANADTVDVVFSDGAKIRCTPDHKILTGSGDWIAASDFIGENDQKITAGGFQKSYTVCVEVKKAPKTDVYCITVPSTGCFALATGVVVANCADETRYACMARLYQGALDHSAHKTAGDHAPTMRLPPRAKRERVNFNRSRR